MDPQNPFKWRHYEADIILLCVRWYLRYTLSYRDLEEMMAERGLSVAHTTIYRCAPNSVNLSRIIPSGRLLNLSKRPTILVTGSRNGLSGLNTLRLKMRPS